MSIKSLDSDQLDKATDILRTLFSRPGLELNDNLRAKNIPGWDSSNHVNPILSISEA